MSVQKVMAVGTVLPLLFSFTLLISLTFCKQFTPTYEIYEEVEIGTYVGNIAEDSLLYTQFNKSEFPNFQYKIQPMDFRFTIDSRTSTVRTAKRLDREAECDPFSEYPCKINFYVTVHRGFQLLKRIRVEVVIKDINDNSPEFPYEETTIALPENFGVGNFFVTIDAIDQDEGGNAALTFSLVEGDGVFGLEVLRSSGHSNFVLGLRLEKPLDREEIKFYNFKVIAHDGGVPPRSGTAAILLRVVDENDNQPQFSNSSFNASVPENVEVGTAVLTLLASDPDTHENGRLKFSFSSPTQQKIKDHLAINSSSGEIYLIKRLDYEDSRSFRFVATVSDHGFPRPKTSQASVHIIVENVNDNAPQIELTVPTHIINESIKVESNIAHIALSDKDGTQNSNFSCSISNDHFRLKRFSEPRSTSYTVILHKRLDYEESRTEILNVTCSDGGNPVLSNSSSTTIHVQDVNDNAPVFTRTTYRFDIDENNYPGKFVAQIKAVDPEGGLNGNVSYALNNTIGGKFSINAFSGVLTAMERLDREQKSSYQLIVIAKDKGFPPMSSSVSVNINVNDIDDNAPHFFKTHFGMHVAENQEANTYVGSVRARDPDDDANHQMRFDVTPNFEFQNVFRLDRMTGVLYTRMPLDREAREVYTFDVILSDENRGGNFHDIAQVSVVVIDGNDIWTIITSCPTDANNTYSLDLPEIQSANSPIDTDANNTYSLDLPEIQSANSPIDTQSLDSVNTTGMP